MIYLIGVDHAIQHDLYLSKYKQVKIDEFCDYIKVQVERLNVDLIAEEYSEEALQKYGARNATLKTVSLKLKIEHRFCDPNSQERKENSIEKGDFEKRERFWIERVQDAQLRNVLFVCGSDHVDGFRQRLLAEGFNALVLSDGWGHDLAGRSIFK